MKKLILPLAFGIFTLALSGCAGYRLGGQKPAHLAGITKLAVPTFENLTLEPRLGSLLTNAVIKQLQINGGYEIVAKEDAEAVLEGKVSGIDRSQFRSDRNNVLRTSQLLMRLQSEFVIRDPNSGAAIHTGRANASSYIVLDANVQLSESQAMEDAAQRLAATIANDITEGW
ncbi:MAG: LPS assembly lipoprotein LptE [Prosthecobacter sp.]|nr:LPS assembly lipoprotein LptE [Prosthecobacter sp.]